MGKARGAAPPDTSKAAKKVVAELHKAHPSLLVLGDGAPARVQHVCPTGISVLDKWVLALGGLAYGRMIEVFGGESVGKDTLVNRIIAGAQRDGSVAALLDTEHKWDPDWAKLHGVDLGSLLWDQPGTVEEVHSETEDLVSKSTAKRRMVIVVNSVAATPTALEVNTGVTGDPAVGEQGRLWSRFCRIMAQEVSRHQALLILVNQVRNKIGVMFGNPEITPAGKAIKHHVYLRLAVGHGKFGDGKRTRFMTVTAFKNQGCPPMRRATLKLDFEKGFDERWAIINHAKEMGCLNPKSQSLKEALENLGWSDVDAPADESEVEAQATEETKSDAPEEAEASSESDPASTDDSTEPT